MNDLLTILCGDALEMLRTLADESVHCCVTSPPYWGLRDYQVNGQLGLEKTPDEYVAKLVEIFREVKRVLRKDGTCWVNLGDAYNGYMANQRATSISAKNQGSRPIFDSGYGLRTALLKPKDLCGIPWRVAFALQDDGWYLRQDIIWAKPNPMPESVTDRCTKAHEYIFLLSKSQKYWYDQEAISETSIHGGETRVTTPKGFAGQAAGLGIRPTGNAIPGSIVEIAENRNRRSVWTITTQPYPEAHFATFPEEIPKLCILAGCAPICCATCKSPFVRVTERIDAPNQNPRPFAKDKNEDRNDTGNVYRETIVKTLGHRPSCACYDKDGQRLSDSGLGGRHALGIEIQTNQTIPGTVFDPFAGSGTTGKVAIELGRKAILIELNPKYVEMIKTRCNTTPGFQFA